MISTVRSRPTYYEILGLAPDAGAEEISRAFTELMSPLRARSVAAMAELSIAFQTLRDPARRKHYDRSIGLTREPPPSHWAFTMSGRMEPYARSAPPARNAPPPDEPSEARIASSIAASLRELARPMASEPPPPPPPVRPRRAEAPSVRAETLAAIERLTAPRLVRETRAVDSEEASFDWKRPALALGVLVAAAGLIGTFAGLSVKDNESPAQAETTGIGAAQPAKPHPKAKAAVPVAAAADPLPTEESRSSAFEPLAPRHESRRPRAVARPRAQPVQAEVANSTPADPGDDAATDSPAQPAAATLPLSNKTVARTIERIGYSCGTVVSTEDSSSGGYKVTCSSGQSYEARPVHGRYRFRRVSTP